LETQNQSQQSDVYEEMANAAKNFVKGTEKLRLSLTDEEAIFMGDLERLSPEARNEYYRYRCEMLGLDPFGHPFDYIRTPIDKTRTAFKTVLYANKNCAMQLTAKRHVSTKIVKTITEAGIHIVTIEASCPLISNGHILGTRSAENIGATAVAGYGGVDLANALKKAVTQATNRAIFTLCGVAELDETEITQIKGAYQSITPEEVERGLEQLKQAYPQKQLPAKPTSSVSESKPEESKPN